MSHPTRLLATLFLVTVVGRSLAADVDPEELRRGLVTTYRDAATPPAEVTRLEPTVGLTLQAGESPHPRLSADGGVYRWQGYLLVVRAGDYRFRAVLRGKLRVAIDDKEVFATESKETTATKESGEIALKDGVRKFEVEFTRPAGEARLELAWSSPFFRTEPLPFDFLGHLPKKLPKRLADDQRSDEGRFLAEEHGCRACHTPPKDILAGPHRGPNLGGVGERVHAGWLLAWLDDPQKVRPGARMPKVFADGEDVERHAVAAFLSSLGGPLTPTPEPPDDKPLKASAERGRALFASVGCVVCHDPDEKPGRSDSGRANYPLVEMAAKTTPEKLAAYLLDPLAVDPSGRMPKMLLRPKEADDLAQFLNRARDAGVPTPLPAIPTADRVAAAFAKVEARETERTRFAKLAPSEQVQELGKRLVVSRRCGNCHDLADTVGKLTAPPSTAFAAVQKKPGGGCMAADAARRGPAPWFGFSEAQRQAFRAYLQSTADRARSPLHEAQTTLRRFNCLACHVRNGEGGLSPALVEELRKHEKAENAEAVSPPLLTGVGHKLRTQTLRDVLLNASRARPWMGLRMPQFGSAAVGSLPEALAHLEGTVPDDTIHKVAATPEVLAAGRHLVGKSAFGCTSCHDIAGIPNTGTRGPDLALTNRRVRYEWWQRWLEQPQRMQPGTRMPTVFTEGKSLLPAVLGGKAEAQGDAMWAYLGQGPTLPLPDGMEPPPGLTLSVRNRAVLLRTFMPDAGSRAFAVGYPGGVAVAFDATACRLAYSWSFKDEFLDATPVWNDRGGNPARLVGSQFWTSPVGFPWAVTLGSDPPDFTARAKDPAWGATLPDRTLFGGERRLSFEGCSLDPAGRPTFRYRARAEGGRSLEVSEQPIPLQASGAPGLRRRFTLTPSAGATVWLLTGETRSEPRLLDENGVAIRADWKGGHVESAAFEGKTPRYLVLPQTDRVVVLAASEAPRGARWDVRRRGDVWQAMLRLTDVPIGAVVSIDLWAPPRDEAALLKELRR